MSIQTHTCITIVCNGCDTGPECDEGEPHYPSAAEAERYLVDDDSDPARWDVADGHHLCPDCLCKRDGHMWEQPRQCRCNGRIQLPGHSADCQVTNRWCARCIRIDEHIGRPVGGSTPVQP
ncbi:MAG: hypothetical protein GEV09_12385 [Pseudonocardiaceae bacterium]|nr:hypothetical protein [Pseudonocardiaceae bacterium]